MGGRGRGVSSAGSGSKSLRSETNPDLITDRDPVALPSQSHQPSPTATQTTADKSVRQGCTKPGDQCRTWSQSSESCPLIRRLSSLRLPLALLVPPLSTAHVRMRGVKACICQSPTSAPVPKVPWRSCKTNDVRSCRSIFYGSQSK